jgi:hypothetical protein
MKKADVKIEENSRIETKNETKELVLALVEGI